MTFKTHYMKNNQTAVEWLVETLNDKLDIIPMKIWDEIRVVVQQAKQMEKKEHKKTFAAGGRLKWEGKLVRISEVDEQFEQYYNETYEK